MRAQTPQEEYNGKASASAVRYVLSLASDPHPLIQAIGPGFAECSKKLTVPAVPQVHDLPSLQKFVTWYCDHILIPVEAPAIVQAAEFQRHYCPRELIELDRSLCRVSILQPFRNASKAVGRAQLRRLLPMRDQKIIRTYYSAVETGRAVGWHFLVFGLVLGLFYIPYRQGLTAYARQTCRHFFIVAGTNLRLPADELNKVEQETTEHVIDRIRHWNGFNVNGFLPDQTDSG